MEYKILHNYTPICLFCGQEEKLKYEESNSYYECDCRDALETRSINAQINILKHKLPKLKYEIVRKNILHKI